MLSDPNCNEYRFKHVCFHAGWAALDAETGERLHARYCGYRILKGSVEDVPKILAQKGTAAESLTDAVQLSYFYICDETKTERN
jgi:hypothetical protein